MRCLVVFILHMEMGAFQTSQAIFTEIEHYKIKILLANFIAKKSYIYMNNIYKD